MRRFFALTLIAMSLLPTLDATCRAQSAERLEGMPKSDLVVGPYPTFEDPIGEDFTHLEAELFAPFEAPFEACFETPFEDSVPLLPLKDMLRLEGAPLDSIEKSFVVVGYSTSYAWPAMLQDMLDEHAGVDENGRVYHVLNAVVGGSPVERWIEKPWRTRTFEAMKRDFLGDSPRLRPKAAPSPTIALCQQSLQFTHAPKGPVTSMHDKQGLKIGADALQRLAQMLHEAGLERVYIAMHIYKEGYEPQVGNERLALAELLDRGHEFVFEGPDVWSLTIARHPEAFTEDRLHPNEIGMKIMAEAWYRVIADVHVKQEVIDALWTREYDVQTMMREYVSWRREGR